MPEPPESGPPVGGAEMRAAQRAFERGDFLDATRRARPLVDSPDEPTRGAAREMIARFRNDPVVIALMAGALVFLGITVAHYLGH